MTLLNDLDNYDDRIYGEKNINYFFSIRDELADEIVTKYICKHAEVTLLPPIINKNKTKNYKVSVRWEDDDIRYLIMYMIMDKRLDKPSIMDVPINNLLRAIIVRSESIIQQAIFDEWSMKTPKISLVCDIICKEISPNPKDIISTLLLTFPPCTLTYNPYGDYYDENQTFYHMNKYRDNYDKKFMELLLELKEEGLVDVRWINEFTLYKITKTHFNNCEYQKKFDWLGQQSLDIYIPKYRVGLEYQGIQHYEPVELFGGEQGFLETKERDERKRKLCLDNGVKLIYWPYNLEVNNDNFEKVIEQAKNQ